MVDREKENCLKRRHEGRTQKRLSKNLEMINIMHRYFLLVWGTSLQIRPAGQLPLRTTRRNGKPRAGKLAVVNLQGTPLDNKSHVSKHKLFFCFPSVQKTFFFCSVYSWPCWHGDGNWCISNKQKKGYYKQIHLSCKWL